MAADGRTMLFLTTQARDGQTCLASALDGRLGTLVWQRQLGLLCRGQPVRLGNQLLVQDQDGSLYLFGPGEFKDASGASWQQVGRKLPGVSGTRTTVRPWLQDFSLGRTYTLADVRAQIKAAERGGARGWLLWNAGVRYTEAAFG